MGKMTPDEYRAKALLLGFRYHEEMHYFYSRDTIGCINPDTLERLSMPEIEVRWRKLREKGLRS